MNIPKYRAYIKATGEMRLVTVSDLWAQTVDAIPLKKKTKTSYLSEVKLYSFNEIELMQCTGLKDIKKVEIYAGDILTIPRCSMIDSFVGNYIGAVKWIKKDARFMIDIIDEKQIIIMECVSQYEIIGNIHQHPELLEK